MIIADGYLRFRQDCCKPLPINNIRTIIRRSLNIWKLKSPYRNHRTWQVQVLQTKEKQNHVLASIVKLPATEQPKYTANHTDRNASLYSFDIKRFKISLDKNEAQPYSSDS